MSAFDGWWESLPPFGRLTLESRREVARRAFEAGLAARTPATTVGANEWTPTNADIVRERGEIHADKELVVSLSCNPTLTGEARAPGHSLKCNREAVKRARSAMSGGCKTPLCNGTGDPAGCTAHFCYSGREAAKATPTEPQAGDWFIENRYGEAHVFTGRRKPDDARFWECLNEAGTVIEGFADSCFTDGTLTFVRRTRTEGAAATPPGAPAGVAGLLERAAKLLDRYAVSKEFECCAHCYRATDAEVRHFDGCEIGEWHRALAAAPVPRERP